MTPYLTDDEIETITHPLKQAAARCKFIAREFGVLVRHKPNGQPIVGRAEYEAALLSKGRRPAAAPVPGGNVVVPDWAGLRRKQKSRAVVR